MYDVVICGAGPAGINAAIASSRLNKKVLLIEATSLLGGTNILSLVGPFMTFHYKNKRVIGGIANEIVERLIKSKASLGHIKDPFAFCSTITPYTNEALKSLYFELIEENNIDLLLHTRVIDCTKENNRITSITICNSDGISKIEALVFVDATGNGDLAFKAKAPFVMGRETDNLCQPMTMPFIVKGVDFEEVKKAMKSDPTNFSMDPNYDFKYVGVSGFFKEVEKGKKDGTFKIMRDRVLFFEGVSHDEAIVNTTRVLGLDPTNASQLTKAEIEGRKQIEITFNFLKHYIPGFKNSYIACTPVGIGIRESRHILCDYVLTKNDLLNHRLFMDSVVVGSYPMDIHSPSSDKLEINENQNNLIYEIPLKSLIPLNNDNLIVTGRIIGATHEACASIRVTPIVMALGEAAGVLASKSVEHQGVVRDVSYHEVQEVLRKNKACPTMNDVYDE